jgi:cyanate permease
MLSRLLEWWAHLYSDSKVLSAAVTYLHLGGILVAGGFAIVTDRASVLLLREQEPDYQRELPRLAGVHTWVLGGLAVTAASGLLMLLADLHTYLTSLLFWTKMALIAALLANGWLRMRAENLLRDGMVSRRALFRRTSLVSVGLWFAVLLAGAFLSTIS